MRKECDPDWVNFPINGQSIGQMRSNKKEDKQTNSFDPEMAQFGGYFWAGVLPNGLSRPAQKGLKNISSVSVPTSWRGDWAHKRQNREGAIENRWLQILLEGGVTMHIGCFCWEEQHVIIFLFFFLSSVWMWLSSCELTTSLIPRVSTLWRRTDNLRWEPVNLKINFRNFLEI